MLSLQQSNNQMRVGVNWLDELKQKVDPGGREPPDVPIHGG